MLTKYQINFVCSHNLNSCENIDYEFSVERSYLPSGTMMLGGIFMVIENSIYDVAKDEAEVFATCYYPQNKAMDSSGNVDEKMAQQVTYDLMQNISSKYELHGTYTDRNKHCNPYSTRENEIGK